MLLVSLFQQPSHVEQPVPIRLFLESRAQLLLTALHTREVVHSTTASVLSQQV